MPHEWAPIPGLERYEVSRDGRIRHAKRKRELSHQTQPNGYLSFRYRDGDRVCKMYIHRAVALAFVDGVDLFEFKTVDHIDRDKLNNHVDNLRWCTPSKQAQNRKNGQERKKSGGEEEGYSDEEWNQALEDGLV